MASSSSSFSSFSALNCIAFVLILLLSFDIVVVQAARPAAAAAPLDPMLKVCSRTTYPKTCTKCITSDESRSTNYDLRGMIGDIIFCAYMNATHAYRDAETLVDDCTMFKNCENTEAAVTCNSTIYDVSQQLLAADDVIKTQDLSKIQAEMIETRTKLNDCAYQKYAGQFSQHMIDEIETTKRLQEIALALCQLSPTVLNVQT